MKNTITFFNLNDALKYNKSGVLTLLRNLPKYPGTSFLRGLTPLTHNCFKYTTLDIMNYLILAGKRDYEYATTYNDYTISRDYCFLSTDSIIKNKLLHLKDNRIIFLYE